MNDLTSGSNSTEDEQDGHCVSHPDMITPKTYQTDIVSGFAFNPAVIGGGKHEGENERAESPERHD